MATSKKVLFIKEKLDELYPETHTFLNYSKEYELLFAVILSAQATDKSVNEATKSLFSKFASLENYCIENKDEIEKIVHGVGLGKSKTSHIIKTSHILLSKYGGEIPHNREALRELPGVGVKTSGVVLAELGIIDALPVDTHVFRVTYRLGLHKETSTDKVEEILEKKFHEFSLIDTHRQLILFGRNICQAKSMKCSTCPFYQNICKYKRS